MYQCYITSRTLSLETIYKSLNFINFNKNLIEGPLSGRGENHGIDWPWQGEASSAGPSPRTARVLCSTSSRGKGTADSGTYWCLMAYHAEELYPLSPLSSDFRENAM